MERVINHEDSPYYTIRSARQPKIIERGWKQSGLDGEKLDIAIERCLSVKTVVCINYPGTCSIS